MKGTLLKKASEKAISLNVNSACILWVYQEKLPKGCERFKKMK